MPANLPIPDTLRIVSFNVKYAEGTKSIARALDMSYIYYPAIFRHRSAKDFGNAVLSRWPIISDAKIVLPHVSRFRVDLPGTRSRIDRGVGSGRVIAARHRANR